MCFSRLVSSVPSDPSGLVGVETCTGSFCRVESVNGYGLRGFDSDGALSPGLVNGYGVEA